MTACYKNAGRWLAGRRPPSYADSGPCPALCLALLAVCAFLVLASWLLQGDLYGRVFHDTIVAVIVVAVVRGRGNTSFAADICATCLLQPVLVVAGPPLGVATAAVAAVARGAPYIFSSRHVLGLVTACILFMGMLQMMSGQLPTQQSGYVTAYSSAATAAVRHATGSGSSATSPQPTPTPICVILA